MSRHYRSAASYRNAYSRIYPKAIIAPAKYDAPTYSLGVFLAATAEVIRTKGFSMCAENAFQLVVANKDGDHEFSVEDWATAAETVAWMLEKDAAPGFDYDLQKCMMLEFIPQGKMRLAVYAVKKYLEHVSVMQAVGETKISQHIGSLKERLTLTVHVFESTYTNGEWGVSYRTKAATSDGNIVTWYAKEQIDNGDYNITGTVAKHNEFRGYKETYLNRVKVG